MRYCWTGSAASAVDLNPASTGNLTFSSDAFSTNGVEQVGQITFTSSTTSTTYAAAWLGSSAAVFSLGQYLPGGATSSGAFSIDAYGNVAGYAVYNGQDHAVEWLAGDTYNLGSIATPSETAGQWNSSGAWLSGVPQNGSDVLVISSDGLSREINFDAPAAVLGNFTVDATGSGAAMTILQSQGSMNAVNEYIGFIGNGIYDETGGSHFVSGTLTLGAEAGSLGTFIVQGLTTLTANNVDLNAGIFDRQQGIASITTMNQTGGTYESPLLIIGTSTGDTANYNYSGGNILATTVNISGGTFTATTPVNVSGSAINTLTVGNGTLNAGIVNLSSGGTLNITGTSYSIANFNQSGGFFSGSILNVPAGSNFTYSAGEFGGTLSNSGNTILAGNFAPTGGWTNYGVMTIDANVTASAAASVLIDNQGTIVMAGGSTITVSSGWTNDVSGVINGAGTLNECENLGSITATGAMSVPYLSNQGTMTAISGGSFQIPAGTFLYNTGDITLAGGAISGSGSLENSGGLIQGGGQISAILQSSGGQVLASDPAAALVINFLSGGNPSSCELAVGAGG